MGSAASAVMGERPRPDGTRGKSSRGERSSKSGQGVRIEERGTSGHDEFAEGVKAMNEADGRKCTATAGSFKKVTTGSQKDSGLDFQGSREGSTWRRETGGDTLWFLHLPVMQRLWGEGNAL